MSDERVSELVGDRLCTGCGYNLTGQPVVREAHYQMLIVRCPECGTVASVQEYPLLGRWAGRWAMALAAAWLGCALVLFLGTAGVLAASAKSVGRSASMPLVTKVNQLQTERYRVAQQSGAANPYGAGSSVAAGEIEAMVADSGGWAKASDWGAMRGWAWLGPIVFCIGCLLATFFMHLRARWLIVLGFAATLLAATFIAISDANSRATYAAYGGWPYQMALDRIGPPFTYGSLVFAFMCLAAGLRFGRPIARGMIRALLPPRLRSSLALLWLADGLAPPSARRGRQGSGAIDARKPSVAKCVSAGPASREAARDDAGGDAKDPPRITIGVRPSSGPIGSTRGSPT